MAPQSVKTFPTCPAARSSAHGRAGRRRRPLQEASNRWSTSPAGVKGKAAHPSSVERSPMAVVLGVNAVFHDPAAAVVVDGETVAAAEEERFSRRKHGKVPVPFSTWEVPEAAARACLARASLDPADVDAVGYSYDPGLALPTPDDDLTERDWEGLRTLFVRRAPWFLEAACPASTPRGCGSCPTTSPTPPRRRRRTAPRRPTRCPARRPKNHHHLRPPLPTLDRAATVHEREGREAVGGTLRRRPMPPAHHRPSDPAGPRVPSRQHSSRTKGKLCRTTIASS